jgi:hypothetical protein
VISRLRRGEQVDVAAEAPPLRVGNDEIGQVGRAFDAVRQTAVAAAVEEARLRQGLNDVFRNLARRNQSLLQRQLTSLDEMERKATDPEVLDDLFKLDHLTTRMRRHAEGLIILSGAPPGRGWSSPVRLVDVMRGAVAEVEDYARVQVATQAKAALSGSAVTDVIHLLAELIENATSLSPPYTQVRVTGEVVSNGFAIEVEDRGLGMTPDRMAELNHRLSRTPDVNPANTEQLGLFVVAQLARRHGISVTLRASPYGGATAVVLVPRELVVDDRPAALPSGGGSAGRRGGSTAADAPAFSLDAPTGFGGAPAGNSGLRGAGAPDGNGRGYGAAPDLDNIPLGNYGPGAGGYQGPGAPAAPAGRGGFEGRFGASHAAQQDDVHVVTGIPVSREAAPPFDPFSPVDRVNGGLGGGPGNGGPGNGTRRGLAATGPQPAYGPNQGPGYGSIDRNQMDYPSGGAREGDVTGLPRRVRQANLAPQLRDSPGGGNGQPGVPQARTTSLQDMRNTLSAMQRGWQQGRTQSQSDTEGNPDGA